MRQDLFFRYADERGRALGFIVRNRSMAHGKLSRLVKTSKFCFSPSGHGWGMRTGKNTMIGCVPLVAQPFVVQAFETELAFEEFSRRVDFEDMPTLAQKLEVGDAELLRLRLEGHRVHRTFMWHAEVGGLAYNFARSSRSATAPSSSGAKAARRPGRELRAARRAAAGRARHARGCRTGTRERRRSPRRRAA